MDARTIEFYLDGVSLGIAYKGIPLPTGIPLCPCVIMSSPGGCVAIQS